MKQLANRKCRENDCFSRTLKFKMYFSSSITCHTSIKTNNWPNERNQIFGSQESNISIQMEKNKPRSPSKQRNHTTNNTLGKTRYLRRQRNYHHNHLSRHKKVQKPNSLFTNISWYICNTIPTTRYISLWNAPNLKWTKQETTSHIHTMHPPQWLWIPTYRFKNKIPRNPYHIHT